MSTVQKRLKSSSLEEEYSEFFIFGFLLLQEEASDSNLLLVGFLERFAALWMLESQGRVVD